MNAEQKFVKCLYIAYKKDIKLTINYDDIYSNSMEYCSTDFDNSFWDDMSEEDVKECIEYDPEAAFYDVLYKYKNDEYWFEVNAKVGEKYYTLCRKDDGTTDLIFCGDDINAFLKEYGGK